ncbi:MAG TPA: ATP-grasp domain-containing protein [Kofleriaceae bacterium]|nr:ATP-grasp domain-containing protein [Kofleriaceae bacterium]
MMFGRILLALAAALLLTSAPAHAGGQQKKRVASTVRIVKKNPGNTKKTKTRGTIPRNPKRHLHRIGQTFLSVAPTARERRELLRAARKLGVTIETFGEIPRDSSDVDANGVIADAVRKYAGRKLTGVIGTDDLGSLVASVVNDRFKLPGASKEAVLRSQHKFLSRESQRLAVLDAHLPRFKLVALDATAPPKGLTFPFFMKPVKAHLSIGARQINNPQEFAQHLAWARAHLQEVTTPFEDIRLVHTGVPISANYMIAEELIKGDQVTVEGFVHKGKARALGVVDSVMYPGTRSFKRFDYPSRHSSKVQRRMNDIATAVAEELGLDNTMFNIEMSYDADNDDIKIIEINPRPSSQFAPLFEAVDGTNSYEIQLRLAAGMKPNFKPGHGKHKVATSFVMRTFQDQAVVNAPSQEQMDRIMGDNPDMRIESFARPGGKLSDSSNDPESFRWAIVTLGGKNEAHMQERLKKTLDALPFDLKPVGDKK